MKIFKQLFIIIFFALVGNIISYGLSLLNVPFPGSLIGMILMFLFLIFKFIKEDEITTVSKFFIDNMGIFFVPGAVSLLYNVRVLGDIWWKLIIILFATFIISFTAVYYSVKLTLYLQKKYKEKKQGGNEA